MLEGFVREAANPQHDEKMSEIKRLMEIFTQNCGKITHNGISIPCGLDGRARRAIGKVLESDEGRSYVRKIQNQMRLSLMVQA